MKPKTNNPNSELIKRIEILRTQGLLTEEEFRQQRLILTRKTETTSTRLSRSHALSWVVAVGIFGLISLFVFSATRSDPSELVKERQQSLPLLLRLRSL